MSVPRSLRSAAVVCAVIVGGAPAHAAPAPSDHRRAPQRTPAHDSLRPADAFEGAGDPRDIRTLARAARTFLSVAWQTELPDFTEDAGLASHTTGGTLRSGFAAGDLTGDGLDDALVLDFDQVSRSFVLHARRGTDGAAIWTAPLGTAVAVYPLARRDLTGDGRTDVVLSVLVEDSLIFECVPFVGCGYRSEFHWDVRVLSGSSGALVWSRTLPGKATAAFAGAGALVGFAGAGAFTVVNALGVPLLSDDHTGDGLPDLVLNAFDYTAVYAYGFVFLAAGAFGFQSLSLFATHAEVARGTDGATALSRTQGYVPGGAVLLPAGDLVGAAGGDLLWQTQTNVSGPFFCVLGIGAPCAQTSRATLDLEAIDGGALATAWRARRDSPETELAFATPALADLTGDGKADLTLREGTGPYTCRVVPGDSRCGQPLRQGVVSGADGTLVWQRDLQGSLLVLGPVGGAPGQDLLLGQFSYCGDGDVTLARLDGATGEMLFTTTATPTSANCFILVFPVPDSDRDGVREILVDELAFSIDGRSSLARIESGRTGARIFERLSTDAYLIGAGDVNADGAPDLYDVQRRYDPRSRVTTTTVTALTLPGGARLWSRTDVLSGFYTTSLTVTGDQSGAGGDDLLYARRDETTTGLRSRVDSIEGRTGAVRWGLGDAL